MIWSSAAAWSWTDPEVRATAPTWASQTGRITAIGRVRERAATEIDADGHVVAPGFIDGHTHLDAQMHWDRLGESSCWHGVTTVLMGNCGFTLAPCRAEEADLVFRSLEQAEEIPRDAMLEGIDWQWETMPEYRAFAETWGGGWLRVPE